MGAQDRSKTMADSGMGSLGASASSSSQDLETGNAELHRGMNSFHLVFIAIGGTIGTGLFLGSGTSLAQAGPVGALIAFLFIGSIVYAVMSALGEMATYMPVAGSFTAYASRFVDSSIGFSMGWIYWFSWSITFALELVASGLIIQYWNDSLSVGIFIAVFWVVFTAVNFLPIKWFGEFEMWFSSIKVVTIVGFIIFAICIDAGAGQNGYLGFSTWNNPGPFAEHIVEGSVGKFVGFWSVMVTAGFSFQGAELVGVGAGEVQNPNKNVPKAIRWTFWGIYALFVALIFFIGLLVPFDNEDLTLGSTSAAASPLVIAANLAGVPVLPHIINGVLLTAVLSAANSNVYSGSRIVVALANEGHAPKFMTYTNRHGVPYAAVGLTSAMGLLAFLNLSASGEKVFTWLLNITSIAGFISWVCILICHLRFQEILAHRGISRVTDLVYRARFQPYLTYFGLFFCILIILTNGFTVFMEWDVSDFFAAYISLILWAVMFLGHKLLVNRTWSLIKLEDVSLVRDSPEEKK